MKLDKFMLKIPKKKMREVTLDFTNTGIYIIQGVNGIGKTTLIEKILYEKSNHIEFPFNEENKHQFVSYLPQNLPQIPLNIADYLFKILKIEKKEHILELISEFELDHNIYESKFNELSGGEQVKIALISALTRGSSYVFLDEPTNNLDDSSVEKMKNVISKYSKDITFVIITHDPRLEDLADSVIIMNQNDISINKINEKNNLNIKNETKEIPFSPIKIGMKIISKPMNLFFTYFFSSHIIGFIFSQQSIFIT